MALAIPLSPAAAFACSTGGGGNAVAYPPPDTKSVSPGTTIFLASASDDKLAVLVDGAPLVGVSDVVVGDGLHDADPNGEVFRRLVLPQMSLPPGAHLEVRVRDNSSPDLIVTATSFDTSSSTDATAGTPPVVSALRLWRVHYPKSEIGSGNCVSAEFWSFMEVDWLPASIPNTAPAGLVHVFSLVPKAGGAGQSFVLGGTAKSIGQAPQGDHPFPLSPGWHPAIDPGVEYCVSARAYGDGDLARPILISDPTCAIAMEVVLPGAEGAGGTSGAGGTNAGGTGGVNGTGGSGGVNGTGGAGLAGTNSTSAGNTGGAGTPGPGGGAVGAGAGGYGAAGASTSTGAGPCDEGKAPDGSCADGPVSSGGGCAVGPVGERGVVTVLMTLGAILGAAARRRRARS